MPRPCKRFEVLAVLSVTYPGNSVNVEVNPVMRTYGVTKAVYVWLRFTRGIFFLVRVVVVAHFSPSEMKTIYSFFWLCIIE